MRPACPISGRGEGHLAAEFGGDDCNDDYVEYWEDCEVPGAPCDGSYSSYDYIYDCTLDTPLASTILIAQPSTTMSVIATSDLPDLG